MYRLPLEGLRELQGSCDFASLEQDDASRARGAGDPRGVPGVVCAGRRLPRDQPESRLIDFGKRSKKGECYHNYESHTDGQTTKADARGSKMQVGTLLSSFNSAASVYLQPSRVVTPRVQRTLGLGYCDTATVDCDTKDPAGEFRGDTCTQATCELTETWFTQGSNNVKHYALILVVVDYDTYKVSGSVYFK